LPAAPLAFAARTFVLALLCLVAAACAGPRQALRLDARSAASLRTVAIVLPPEPRTYAFVNMGNPALALTLVGGIFVAADQDDKETRLHHAMLLEKFSLKRRLAARLQASLAAAGYRTLLVDGTWENRGGRLVLRPDLVPDGADALLVVVPLTTGFVSRGAGEDYVPTVTVLARLLARDGSTELYRAFHAYGWQPRAEGWRFSPAAGSFSDFPAVLASPAASAAALAEGADAVATSIAKDLRR
jgi:hypothetical protein